MEAKVKETEEEKSKGPKYFIDIEGTLKPWDKDTITTEEIIGLGGWNPSQGAIIIDEKTQVERTLNPGEVVEIKPGLGFARKVKFKRGLIANSRIQTELELLKKYFPEIETAEGNWFRIQNYPLPQGMSWNKTVIEICFQAPVGYPCTPPYGIYVPSDLRINDQVPESFQPSVNNKPPFDGSWGMFSWTPEEGNWNPSADASRGSSLLDFVLTFDQRFKSGK